MCDDVPEALDRAPVRRILPKRNMRMQPIIIGGEFRKNPPQVLFVEYDQMTGCRFRKHLRHGRRHWVSFGVTENPTAVWIARQITEAFPWDYAPRYLIRDRETSYGLRNPGRSAGHPHAGAKANVKLTFNLDHSMGADHPAFSKTYAAGSRDIHPRC